MGVVLLWAGWRPPLALILSAGSLLSLIRFSGCAATMLVTVIPMSIRLSTSLSVIVVLTLVIATISSAPKQVMRLLWKMV